MFKQVVIMRKLFVLNLLLLVVVNGCSIQKMAIRATGDIFDAGFETLMEEGDLQLAKSSAESNLKLVETLIKQDPENKQLLLLAAEGFTSYALAFAEDNEPERAVKLYYRSRYYANRWIKEKTGIDLLSLKKQSDFEAALKKLPSSTVPGLFWMGNAWGSALLLDLSNIESISGLPKTEAIMRVVLERDETFYYGGVHLFFCGYYGGRSKMMGGDQQKALEHINRHAELSNHSFMIGEVFRVKYVALPTFDETMAREAVKRIKDYDLDKTPKLRLVNRVAKEKAILLEEEIIDYFE